jgi:hypothetical protein
MQDVKRAKIMLEILDITLQNLVVRGIKRPEYIYICVCVCVCASYIDLVQEHDKQRTLRDVYATTFAVQNPYVLHILS